MEWRNDRRLKATVTRRLTLTESQHARPLPDHHCFGLFSAFEFGGLGRLYNHQRCENAADDNVRGT
jgi:hypothetical protein